MTTAHQEFAERVAKKYWGGCSGNEASELVELIASELRADGWVRLAKPVKEPSVDDYEYDCGGGI